MTQIVVTLENGADSSLLRQMIENMKGVLKTSLRNRPSSDNSTEVNEWIDGMRELSGSIDSSIIDMDDERTRYIMSK